ncbi:hypothetical protein K437DRAFT_269978 [Tilletiaria anomala UBC 951]|uniref:DNA mismatch repair protein MutL n=1 Tax=Tilletiaria anomala (strain ATCC 24038 / CBS 436.72 / UBC 951) TaxID=1037660 RepID=A0A066VPD6_TILAU|nr:uncharacterized protein K437DRAFT_269978 [Tilletiaria anomala UBC 951]KDN40420.1 hypothetical protein K437DRAFT_269978 [Tilletiaria anomala UBC 951]
MTGIQRIAPPAVHRITSNQIVLDLQTAVKELVENALDAHASSIDVRFSDYGATSLDVVDNGTGIPPEDWHAVGLKYHTSKIAAWTDLASVATFGFRGEAISSLCALCRSVSLATTTHNAGPLATILPLKHDGSLDVPSAPDGQPDLSALPKVARQRGTTVSIHGLFDKLPVRRREFERNIKREYAKTQAYLQAYALISKGVRWSVSNTPKGGRKQVVLTLTPPRTMLKAAQDPSKHLLSNVTCLFGPKVASSVIPLALNVELASQHGDTGSSVGRGHPPRKKARVESTSESDEDEQPAADPADGLDRRRGTLRIHITGLISRPSSTFSHSSSNRQFYYINGRPWDIPARLSRAFNEVYRSFHTNDQATTTNTAASTSTPTGTPLGRSSSALSASAAGRVDGSTSGGMTAGGSQASAFPFVLANFEMPPDSYDINMSPDKRTIWLAREKEVAEALREALEALYKPWRSTFAVGAASAGALRSAGAANRSDKRPGGVKGTVDRAVQSNVQKARQTPTRLALQPVASDVGDQGNCIESDQTGYPSEADSQDMDDLPRRAQSRAHSDASHLGNEPEAAKEMSQNEGHSDAALVKMQSHEAPSSSSTPTTWHPPQEARLQGGDARSRPPVRRRESVPDSVSPAKRAETTLKDILLKGSQGKEERTWKTQSCLDSRGIDSEKEAPPCDEVAMEQDSVNVDARLSEGLSLGEDYEQLREGHDEEVHHFAPPASMRGARANAHSGLMLEEERQLNLARLDDVSAEEAGEPSQEEVLRTALPLEQRSIAVDWGQVRKRASRLRRPKASEAVFPYQQESHADEETGRSDTVVAEGGEQAERSGLTYRPRTKIHGAGVHNQDASVAEGELNRTIHQVDFLYRMTISGQFNLAFIIARRLARRDAAADGQVTGQGEDDDLFIIDQHAADEKYNFEELQKVTKIRSQPLIVPRTLELSAADELVAFEHMDTLKHDGFDIRYDEDAPPGTRVTLLSQPVSRGTIFGIKDLEELLHLLADVSPGTAKAASVRCSKARAMFAMRACRKSVMVGKALSRRQMTAILRHMGTMESPWNCPHGRPTMRHLANLNTVPISSAAPRPSCMAVPEIKWSEALSGYSARRRGGRYAFEPDANGKPIAAIQSIQHLLAKAWTLPKAAKHLTVVAAPMYDERSQSAGVYANALKYIAAEARYKACKTAVTTLGRMGYAREYHVKRHIEEISSSVYAGLPFASTKDEAKNLEHEVKDAGTVAKDVRKPAVKAAEPANPPKGAYGPNDAEPLKAAVPPKASPAAAKPLEEEKPKGNVVKAADKVKDLVTIASTVAGSAPLSSKSGYSGSASSASARDLANQRPKAQACP